MRQRSLGVVLRIIAEDLRLSKREQQKQRRAERRDERRLKREARHDWNSSGDLKSLAIQLGVARVIAAKSKRCSEQQGEYVAGTLDEDWIVSDRLRAIINGITEYKDLSVILIDVEEANNTFAGVRGALAHEIGHRIDWLANPRRKENEPNRTFLSAFYRAGFWASPDTEDELIAETFGQYLLGHDLPSVLLAKVNDVLTKLQRRAKLRRCAVVDGFLQSEDRPRLGYVKIIKNFRRSQIAKNAAATPRLDKTEIAA
jgi:hypothetical protein